jgi:hypothetical protein
MERREFLRGCLLLGSTGAVPEVGLVVNNFDEARGALLADNIAKYGAPSAIVGLEQASVPLGYPSPSIEFRTVFNGKTSLDRVQEYENDAIVEYLADVG